MSFQLSWGGGTPPINIEFPTFLGGWDPPKKVRFSNFVGGVGPPEKVLAPKEFRGVTVRVYPVGRVSRSGALVLPGVGLEKLGLPEDRPEPIDRNPQS